METHLLQLSRLMVGEGADVTLVSRYAHDSAPIVQKAREIPIRLIRTPFHKSERLYRLSTLWALAVWPFRIGTNYDLLYSLEATGINRFLRRFLKPKAPVLFNLVGAPPSLTQQRFPEAILHSISGFLVESRSHEKELRGIGLSCPIRVLPLLGHVDAPPKRNRTRCEGPLRLAYLGRFDQQKGVFQLLEWWPHFDIQPATLTFYGHGPEKQNLQLAIRKRNLQDHVRVGPRWDSGAELARILEEVDLVVHASEVEGLSLALLESLAHGVPFVASDAGVTRELAEDNPDVAVVPLTEGAFLEAVEEVAQRIRSGRIDGQRLQAYHQAHFGFDRLARGWKEALLEPESWLG